MTTSLSETTELSPSYKIPIALTSMAIPLLFLSLWVSGSVLVFGLFLWYQTTTLRLVFTSTALEVYRKGTEIRRFPYQDWQTWEIFWDAVPILFYFREVNSIHFLPIIFSSVELKSQLEQRVPLNVD